MGLSFLVVGVSLMAGAAAAVPVEISVSIEGLPPGNPVKVTVRAVPAKQEMKPVVFALQAPESRAVDLAPRVAWTVVADADGYWAADRTVVPMEATPTPVRLALLPAGSVEGRLAVAQGESPPHVLNLHFRAVTSSPKERADLEDEVACSLDKGAFRCVVPAGSFDLRLRAPGFISHYFWDVKVAAGGTLKLGNCALKRGASVVGWVQTLDGLPGPSSCTVELAPKLGGLALGARQQDTQKALVLSTKLEKGGFFHFKGVPPGSYIVTAHQAGFAPITFFPVPVRENSETEVQKPLVLRPPLTLEVVLTPPSDPWQRPWRVFLMRRGNDPFQLDDVIKGEPASEGRWQTKGLASGKYVVVIADEGGSGWVYRDVELEREGEQAAIDIPIVPVRGTVSLGKKPVPALLVFGGEHGALSIRMRADQEGEFRGYLPKEGRWKVGVVLAKPPIRRNLDDVEVERLEGAREAIVEIRLPGTTLGGEVVDESGQPVGYANLSIRDQDRRGTSVNHRADMEGRVRLAGLAPGRISLMARAGTKTSSVVTVDLQEGSEPPPVHLVLEKNASIVGQVIGPAGPVAGAGLSAIPVGWQGWGDMATTDGAGSFSLSLADDVRQAILFTMAPGFALKTMRVPVGDAKPVVVVVDQFGGTLTLLLPRPAPDFDRGEWTVVRSMYTFSLSMLGSWAMMNGESVSNPERMVVPQLESGDYSVCWVWNEDLPLVRAGGIPVKGCAGGYLPPNGQLNLKLSVPERSSTQGVR